MAKITRKTQKIFGGDYIADAGQEEISVFGSLKDGSPTYSVDPDAIQNANYLQGWNDAVLTSLDGLKKMPLLQDSNALFYVLSRNLAYLNQAGIAEYDSGTTYYIGDICREAGTTNLYKSITDDNVGNALTDVVEWTLLGDLSQLLPATTEIKGVSYLSNPITISNNVTDPDHDIDFSAGVFQFDDGSGQAVASAMTKKLDASWAPGNDAGGLDTGTVGIDSKYHCFAIYNPTTDISDFLFSASFSSPILPSGYTKKKWRMTIFTDGSANIKSFSQNGKFIQIGQIEYNDPTVPASYTDLVLGSCPNDIRVEVTLSVFFSDNVDNSIDFLDKETNFDYTPMTISANNQSRAAISMFTDTSATIQHKGTSTPATDYVITLLGWKIPDLLF
jgi:hypothetical protein